MLHFLLVLLHILWTLTTGMNSGFNSEKCLHLSVFYDIVLNNMFFLWPVISGITTFFGVISPQIGSGDQIWMDQIQ